MSRQEKLEDQMATIVPSLLVAVAIFCLTVMALETSSKRPFVDEFFGLLRMLSIIFAAWIIDSQTGEYFDGIKSGIEALIEKLEKT